MVNLHYINNDQELKDGQLILMDMGGLAGGYVSDVTSTVPVNGKFTNKQKEIYNIVLDANLKVQQEAKPGVSWLDMHLAAERVIITGLRSLGLLSNSYTVDQMLNDRVAYYFMPHGLGHLIGIDVHDAGGYLSFTPSRSKEKGLNFNLAKPYPARDEINTCPIVVNNATIKLFKKYLAMGIDLNTFLYAQKFKLIFL